MKAGGTEIFFPRFESRRRHCLNGPRHRHRISPPTLGLVKSACEARAWSVKRVGRNVACWHETTVRGAATSRLVLGVERTNRGCGGNGAIDPLRS